MAIKEKLKSLKIVVICRTLNEEKLIKKFCNAYNWVDKILIADTCSTDRTVEYALKFPNVEVYKYKKFEKKKGFKHAHEGLQINFLIRWGKRHNPDWIIFDDVDSIPSKGMRNRELFELSDAIYAYRLYAWKKEQHFPMLSMAGRCLWAWSRKHNVSASSETGIHFVLHGIPEESKSLGLDLPNALVHFFYIDDKEIVYKEKYFKAFGLEVKPLEHFGYLMDLPRWARWENL